MKFYGVVSFYAKDEVIRDVINYCVNNPENLNFGDRLNINYRKLEFGFGYMCVAIESKDKDKLYDFKDIAQLLREV